MNATNESADVASSVSSAKKHARAGRRRDLKLAASTLLLLVFAILYTLGVADVLGMITTPAWFKTCGGAALIGIIGWVAYGFRGARS